MSSNTKKEDDQLYDMLNLSPNLMMNSHISLNAVAGSDIDMNNPSQVDVPMLSERAQGKLDLPPPAPTSNEFHTLPDANNLSIHTLFGNNGSHSSHSDNHTPTSQFAQPLFLSVGSILSNNFLNPNSPGNQSTHSLYSDYSSNAASPYFDALSNVSHNQNSPNMVPAEMNLGENATYFDSNYDGNFDSEIALGGSISSVNLANLGKQQFSPKEESALDANQYQQISQLVQMQLASIPARESHEVPANPLYNLHQPFYDSHQLEEISKINSNFNPPTIVYPQDQKNVSEEVWNRTPSLFSNSSHNSLTHTDSHHQEGGYLAPDEPRRSRKKSSSSIRSRSGSRSADEDDESPNVISSREKMLELASPNQISKRTQKHPSAYACHLCGKRFTRPYNLKSHLRTHTDERPFICSICGKAFARQHDKKRHEDLHSGEKRFQCKGVLKDGTPYGCGRRFARADALRRHFQTDAGKICIKALIEEEEQDKHVKKEEVGSSNSGDSTYLSPGVLIPHVAILPPEP